MKNAWKISEKLVFWAFLQVFYFLQRVTNSVTYSHPLRRRALKKVKIIGSVNIKSPVRRQVSLTGIRTGRFCRLKSPARSLLNNLVKLEEIGKKLDR